MWNKHFCVEDNFLFETYTRDMPGSSELIRQSPASCEPELQQCPSSTTAPSFLCSYRNGTGCAWETTHPGETLDHLMTGSPRAQDHILVDQGREDGADNWPDPVDEIILLPHQLYPFMVGCSILPLRYR